MTATLVTPTEPGRPTPQLPREPAVRRARLPWMVLAASVVLFVYGESTIPYAQASQFGLLGAASPAYGLSILLAAAGFALAVRRADGKAAVAATAVMILTQRLPALTATELPLYSWTFKHLGVVDYIQHSQTLARDVDVYNCWPGLFAVTAWFSDVTGVAPMTIAHWFTPVYHVLFAVLVYGAARAWQLRHFTALTATFLVATLNWVCQDYFAPQAIAIFLAVAIIALIGLSHERAVATPIIIGLFAAITVTHQLTPYWLLLMIGILVISRKMKPWWIVFPLAAIVFAFYLYNWDQVARYPLLSTDLLKNVDSNIPTKGVLGQQITSMGVRFLSASMWLATALTLVVRWRRKQPFWTLAVLALSPMLILGGQDYGGEAVFRVFLYSLIGCSFVLAPVLESALQGSRTRYVGAFAGLVVATGLAAQGCTGAWYANVMPKQQWETSQLVLAEAEPPVYIAAAAPAWPERGSWRYVEFARFRRDFDTTMVSARRLALRKFDNDADYQEFIRLLDNRSDAPTYLIFTEQARVYAWYYGILPWEAIPNLKARIHNDPVHWRLVYEGGGITVFYHDTDPVLPTGQGR